ncbi:MAG: hypothetical protein Q8P90_03240 [bacterium]|nr:hypothetical protein [bacterium]
MSELKREINLLPTVKFQQGLIFFQGRENLIKIRKERYLESERKFKKRMPFIKLLTYLPHVEAIFIVNSLAYQNAKNESDVDLLIISKSGKIWSTRFFTTTVAKLLGIRPKPNYTKDTLCLSFYLDASALAMHDLMNSSDDVYEIYWLRQLLPIYDPNNYAKKIFESNQWVEPYLPNAKRVLQHPHRIIKHTIWHSLIQNMLGIFTPEKILKKIQLAILPEQLKKLSGPVESSVVVLSDLLLKFHINDPRPEWTKQWEEKIKQNLPSIS